MDTMERIQSLMDGRDLNRSALANIAGVSKGTVSQWFGGQYAPKTAPLGRIADYFGVTVEYLLHGESARPVAAAPSRTVPVRVVGVAHAGEPDEPWQVDGEAMLYEEIAARHPGCFALEVNGDCMDRMFTSADHVFVDPNGDAADGSIVVVAIDGEVVVRRLKLGNGTMLLVSESHDAAAHPDILVKFGSSDVRVIGTVFWWQARRSL